MADDFKAEPIANCDLLPMPAYSNPAEAAAVARCRRDGGPLYRVMATYKATGERFGFDLPPYDARGFYRDFSMHNTHAYCDATIERIR
jgi:hypothetical protein